MARDFNEDDLVYGDSWGLVHRGVLEDREIERMKALRDKVYGKVGVAITTLKPIGRVEIDGEVYEARLNNGYLDVRTQVKAVGVDVGYVLVNEYRKEGN
ncbi:NfeD family protein [Listeria ilorinensis]|uniref:NfeD family protein n=1 Tax=Listeria ilorinensis TaxID=2867439 RepID=UPI001EF41E51|nr:NfeD family protein [Listeria ilorinensis]